MATAAQKRNSGRAILLVNASQLVTMRPDLRTEGPRRGADMRNIGIVADGAVLCSGGKIVSAGSTREALHDPWIKRNRKRLLEVDCSGCVVIPGFVDAHTHPVFVLPRLLDFERRISGASYEKIAESGGGIRSSVEGVRSASKPKLAGAVLSALEELASFGTTTVETKSGYGLSLAAEMKSLEAIRLASTRWPGTVVPTLLGAHVVPTEFRDRPEQYTNLICDEMIPQAARRKLAGFVDVFCDRGAFDEESTLKIAAAAQQHGLGIRAHISQLMETPLNRILGLNPVSLDHLDRVSDSDIELLARSQTVATLVPGANYFLGLAEYPPARRLIDAGGAVALATDYNPGSSPVPSMPLILSIACTHMRMSPAEALCAGTINGAWSVALGDCKGSIEPGKDADLAIFDVRDYREIAYWAGAQRCKFTVMNGVLMNNRQSTDLPYV